MAPHQELTCIVRRGRSFCALLLFFLVLLLQPLIDTRATLASSAALACNSIGALLTSWTRAVDHQGSRMIWYYHSECIGSLMTPSYLSLVLAAVVGTSTFSCHKYILTDSIEVADKELDCDWRSEIYRNFVVLEMDDNFHGFGFSSLRYTS